MKPKEKKPETVYRIIDKATNMPVGSYSRAYCLEYDFNSIHEARTANCHDVFKDRVKYGIAEYRVVYELISGDVDPATKQDRDKTETEAKLHEEMEAKGITSFQDQLAYTFQKLVDNVIIDAVRKEGGDDADR